MRNQELKVEAMHLKVAALELECEPRAAPQPSPTLPRIVSRC